MADLSAGSVTFSTCGVVNVLMVTTTVRMLAGVHSDNSNSATTNYGLMDKC